MNKEALFHALVEQSLQEKDAAFQRFEDLPGTPREYLDRLITRPVEGRRATLHGLPAAFGFDLLATA